MRRGRRRRCGRDDGAARARRGRGAFPHRFAEYKCDRIAAALDEIRAGLDGVAAALDPLPLALVFREPMRKSAAPALRPHRTVVAPAPSAPEPAQELLPLIFS